MLNSSTQGVDVRPLTITDAPALLTCLLRIDDTAPYLLYEPGERNWDSQTTQMVIEQSNQTGVFLGALIGEQVIGYLLMQGADLLKIRHSAQIVVAVDAAYRQQGIGKRLFTTAIELAKAQGLSRLELSVMPQNLAAMRMYEKFGFVQEGVKKQAIKQGDQFMDEIMMAKLLK
ncbi:GNAT family N-acetyltransferase [Periweissella ghanensis]|uniref:N-acetyltransferase domain-containing protein n=1 Tax=Periweissella ghanensis TaxID=467997 RepID=A0ABM8ZD44_9LACO|nr:GNAT family N-acetyltransferase [Periweissella ghanensis]MCM0600307.1 GNAT family N-acetyltransferase [Periweissella ghanensis]CAH0419219.1 hypothetical protein WGH24286_01666 [Periweissella ghanensis]